MKRLRKKIIVYILCGCILCGSLYGSKMQAEAVAEAAAIDLMEVFTTILLTMGVAIYIDTVIQNPDTGVLNPPTGWQDWDEYNIVAWQWCYLLNMEEAGGSGTDPGDPEDPDNKDKTGSKFWQWLQQYKVPASAVGISMPMVLYMQIKERSKQVVDNYVTLDNLWYAPVSIEDRAYFDELLMLYSGLSDLTSFSVDTSKSDAPYKFLTYCQDNVFLVSAFQVEFYYQTTKGLIHQIYVEFFGSEEPLSIVSYEVSGVGISTTLYITFDNYYKCRTHFSVNDGEISGTGYFTKSDNGMSMIALPMLGQEFQDCKIKQFMKGSFLNLPVDASVKDDTLLDPEMIAVTPGLEVTPEGEIAGDLELEIPENLPELIEKTKTGEITLPEFSEEVGITPTPKPDIPQTPVVPPAPPAVEDPEEPPEAAEPYVVDLRKIFPFCIPFDFYDFMLCLSAEPEAPHFTFSMPTGYQSGEVIYTEFEMDLSQFDEVALNLRRLELFAFIIGLMFLTRQVFIRS